MHYLKCTNCGHMNEVRTENLIFCSACHKKLTNNFHDWKKVNPEKNMDDFKVLFCISDAEINEKAIKAKTRPVSLKYWIGFAMAVAIFTAIGKFGGDAIVQFFSSEKTAKSILELEWMRDTYGDYGLSVETPVKMTRSSIELPDEINRLIDHTDNYNYSSAKGFKVMINSTKYNSAMGGISLQGAANSSVNEMRMQQGVTEFSYSEDYVYKNDIPGFIQTGNYRLNGAPIEFINAGFSKDLILWQVLLQVANHGTDHRAQILRLLSDLGVKTESQDYIFYVYENP